jgi:hypothetical protein
VVVAPGHSARDVQRWLRAAGVSLSFKPFALGVRIEHPQALIDRLQYGGLAGHPALGAASYRLVEQTPGGAVFSFCMCPGGFIVPAATDPGMQVVNGMSPSARTVASPTRAWSPRSARPSWRGRASTRPTRSRGSRIRRRSRPRRMRRAAVVSWRRRRASGDLVRGRLSKELPATSYHRGLEPARLDQLLGSLGPPLQHALRALGERMPGFLGPEAVAVGLESRTSCPVRHRPRPGDAGLAEHAGAVPERRGGGLRRGHRVGGARRA